jgi:hypothetical protein
MDRHAVRRRVPPSLGDQPADAGRQRNRSDIVSNADEKRVKKLAERKGFHIEKGGHGKGHGRFYVVNVAESSRVRSGVAEHEYSFSLEEAEAWLTAYSK